MGIMKSPTLLGVRNGQNNLNSLHPFTRELMLRVVNECPAPALQHLMFQIWQYTHCDAILKHLISEGLIGFKLLEFFVNFCKGNPYNLATWCVRCVNKNHDGKTLYGRDWKERS